MMKSSRLRFELGARQKIPRLQMSPMWIGVVVICVGVQVAILRLLPGGLTGGSVRLVDWAA